MPSQGAQLLGETAKEELQLLARGRDFLGSAVRGGPVEVLGKRGLLLPGTALAAAQDGDGLPLRHEPDEVEQAQAPLRLPAPERLAVVGEQEEEDLLCEVRDLLPDVAACSPARASQQQAAGHAALNDGGQALDEPVERRLVACQGPPYLLLDRLVVHLRSFEDNPL